MSAFQTFTTKVKQSARSAWQAIRSVAAKVTGSKAVQVIVTKVKQPTRVKVAGIAKVAGTRFAISLLVVLAFRLIKNRGKVKHLWRDRKNSHRRFASVLWETLMVEAAYTVFSFSLIAATPVLLLSTVVSLIAGAVVDIAYRLYHGRDYAPWHTHIAYSGLRFTAQWTRKLLLDIPFSVLKYEPKWLRDFVAPAYQTVETVESVVSQEEPVKEEPVDVTSVKVEYEEVVEENVVHLDGNDFTDDPKAAGENLARKMTQMGKTERQRFRKDLPKKMREAGLTAREVTLGLHGFDRALATV